ncbi:hypothetical protein MHU86_11650 [Fragilaria crotonensis]|nr:hypothetical protein MHU86_11650 [Fragilaria crotonensis]
MRFETKNHLRDLSKIFGESVTAGQRCRLPKVSVPKTLWKNDIINVVCGSDDCEPTFNSMTVRDGIDLEFDGTCELFITIRYRRYAYSASLDGCDPLLASLICRHSVYATPLFNEDDDIEDENQDMDIMTGSEFVDDDGCLYRVIKIDSMHVHGKCVYPRQNNDLFGNEKLFDILLTKELIQQRLNG